MKKFYINIKKWNWCLFLFVLLVCGLGAAGNKSITSIGDGLLLVSGFGIPIGLIMAWLTKDDN